MNGIDLFVRFGVMAQGTGTIITLDMKSLPTTPWVRTSYGGNGTATLVTDGVQYYAPADDDIKETLTVDISATDAVQMTLNMKVSDDGSNAWRGGLCSIFDGSKWITVYARNTTLAYYDGTNVTTFATGLTLTNYFKMDIIKDGTSDVVVKINDSVVGTIAYANFSASASKAISINAQQSTTAIYKDLTFTNYSA